MLRWGIFALVTMATHVSAFNLGRNPHQQNVDSVVQSSFTSVDNSNIFRGVTDSAESLLSRDYELADLLHGSDADSQDIRRNQAALDDVKTRKEIKGENVGKIGQTSGADSQDAAEEVTYPQTSIPPSRVQPEVKSTKIESASGVVQPTIEGDFNAVDSSQGFSSLPVANDAMKTESGRMSAEFSRVPSESVDIVSETNRAKRSSCIEPTPEELEVMLLLETTNAGIDGSEPELAAPEWWRSHADTCSSEFLGSSGSEQDRALCPWRNIVVSMPNT